MNATLPDLSIGLDLGDRSTRVCVLDRDGQLVGETPLPTNREPFEALFNSVVAAQPRVIFEVGSQSRWVQKLARECGIKDILVVSPRKLALISKNLKKTDQNDAYLLARAGQAMPDLLSPVEHVSDDIYADRALMDSRALLVRQRTQLITRIRSLAKACGVSLRKCSAEYFARKAPEHIPALLRPACQPLFAVLEQLDQQIAAIEKACRKLIKEKYPIAAKLQRIGGVGPIIALCFVLAVGDPSRIRSPRNIGAYFGMTPRKQQSGGSDPQLGITKAGNSEARRSLVLAAHCLFSRGKDCALKRWAHAICQRGGRNAKKRAVVALARKLAVVMLAIWKSGETYDPWHGVALSERPPLSAA